MLVKSLYLLIAGILLAGIAWYFIPRSEFSVKSYTYKQTPQGKLKLEIHFPHQWTAQDQRPIAVFFFGGAWISGGIEHFRWQADYLARRGMLAARVDYRVDSRQGTLPNEAVADGRDAIRWLRENASRLGIDPDRVVAAGGSSGGHIAASTTVAEQQANQHIYSAIPNLLVLFNPVLDLENPTVEMGFSQREQELIELMGPDTALTISPNHQINNNTPPTLFLMGGDDPLLEQAKDYVAKAQLFNVQTSLYVAANQDHGFFNWDPWREATMIVMDRFLSDYGYLQGKIPVNQTKAQLTHITDDHYPPRNPATAPTDSTQLP